MYRMLNGRLASMRTVLALAVVVTAASVAPARAAHADLMFTNYSQTTAYVAIGFYDPSACGSRDPWRSVGWYAVPRGETVKVYNGSVSDRNRYWYFYADAEDGSTWSGDYYFPVDPVHAFDLCHDAGGGDIGQRGFREFDVDDADDFTMILY